MDESLTICALILSKITHAGLTWVGDVSHVHYEGMNPSAQDGRLGLTALVEERHGWKDEVRL